MVLILNINKAVEVRKSKFLNQINRSKRIFPVNIHGHVSPYRISTWNSSANNDGNHVERNYEKIINIEG